MALRELLAYALLLSLSVMHRSLAKEAVGLQGPGSKKGTRQLKRSNGQRWDSIHEVVRAEIKSATRQFLEERSRALILPIEVDLLLVGFDGDGGYGYQVDRKALDELLGTATEDNTICPTVWETGESAAVCYSVNYITLDPSKVNKGVERMERALAHNMEWVGDRSQDWPDGSKEVQVYEVESNGEIEATVWELLDEAYEGKEPEVNRRQHSQIVIINPSKLRMKNMLPPPPANQQQQGQQQQQAGGEAERQRLLAAADKDFIGEWKKGLVGSSHVVEQEAGFLYRYSYSGRGGGSAFVGQYNFLVIDVSAGPVSYGPLASPSGSVAPTAMPRLMPMLLRMTRELEANPQPGTLRAHLLEEAAQGQAAVFAGQLASTVAAATRHLFASDLWMEAAEGMGGANFADGPKRVVVPIIVMQDHVRELEHEDGGLRWVDSDLVQLALDEMLPPDIQGAVSVSRHMLHHHKHLAAALVKARHSRSDAVLSKAPDVGLHRSETTSLDSAVLLRELRLAAADDDLMGSLIDHISDDYVSKLPNMGDPDEFLRRRKHDSRVIPVFVFSLERSPDQMMLDNKQLVAAAGGVVAVLQLLGNPASDDYDRGRVYSGHMAEGHHLLVDAGESPTRAVIAGLATALGGMVPAHQRYCAAERAVVEDWRWAVGAVPWGPYSNYTALSSVFAATVRRNLLVARIERPLRRLLAALNRIDAFVVRHLQAPFAFLRHRHSPAGAGAGAATWAGSTGDVPFHIMPHHHLLDDLARQHVKYQNQTNGAKSTVRNLLSATKLGSKVGSSKIASAATHGSSQHHPHHSTDADDEGHFIVPDDPNSPHHDYPDGPADHHDPDPEDPEDDGTYDTPIILPPEAVDAAHLYGASRHGHSKGSNPEGLVVDQQALSPDVAQRLQKALADIGDKLEHISFLMFSRNWAELEDVLPIFAAAVTAFEAAADRDLTHAAEVVSCCSVTHVTRGSPALWFALGAVVLALGSFAILAYVALRSQRVYSPRLARTPSTRSRSLSGSLPSWSAPSTPSLPR